MKKALLYITTIIASLSIIIALAFSAMEIVIFKENSYHKSFEENELYDFIGINENDLKEVTHEMLEYLRGNREDLIMFANIRGQYQQVFEGREIMHMVDVQELFLAGFKLRNISLIIASLFIAALLIVQKKKAFRPLSMSYLWTMAGVFAVALVLGIIILIDFNALFLKFHEAFFDNDLWLLNINTDVLIQMLPEEFFNKLALNIVALMSIFISIPAIFSAIYLIGSKKHNAVKQ